MIKNKFGEIVYNIEDVVDLIMKQQSTAGITVDTTVQLEDTSPETDISLSVDEFKVEFSDYLANMSDDISSYFNHFTNISQSTL